MYDYQDFSKADKKKLQPLISVAVQNEIASFAKKMLPVHQELTVKDYEDIRDPFWKMFEQYKKFQKYMVRTYDGYSHREIPIKIASAIVNGYLTMEDIADFSPDGKEKLKEMIERMR